MRNWDEKMKSAPYKSLSKPEGDSLCPPNHPFQMGLTRLSFQARGPTLSSSQGRVVGRGPGGARSGQAPGGGSHRQAHPSPG